MTFKGPKSAVSNQRGFTFVELMIVMGIFGVLATIALQQVTHNRAKAHDTKVVALIKNLLTYAAVDEPVGEQDDTENKPDLSQVGYSDVQVIGGFAFTIRNTPEDMWQFTFAHPAGITGYYFWIPGDNCVWTDDNGDGTGIPSDSIQEDITYRGLVGLP